MNTSRQEKDSVPLLLQLPQHDVVSRSAIFWKVFPRRSAFTRASAANLSADYRFRLSSLESSSRNRSRASFPAYSAAACDRKPPEPNRTPIEMLRRRNSHLQGLGRAPVIEGLDVVVRRPSSMQKKRCSQVPARQI